MDGWAGDRGEGWSVGGSEGVRAFWKNLRRGRLYRKGGQKGERKGEMEKGRGETGKRKHSNA
jgi:hypothetical protein